MRFMRRISDFLASYGLACILLFLLFLITILGTIEQKDIGLYAAQQKYFTSLLVPVTIGAWDVPLLPGGYLLMGLLAINLLAGGILRLGRTRGNVGMFVVHGGMIFMLLAGLVTHHFADEGRMALLPGESSRRFESYHEWEVALIDASSPEVDREYVLPAESFNDLGGARSRVFSGESLPFSLELAGYMKNSLPAAVGPMVPPQGPRVGNVELVAQPPALENEQNTAGLVATIREAGAEPRQALLWGYAKPWRFEAGGKEWYLMLRRRQWSVPFSITLEKFIHEYHPGTQVARTYESDVIKTEGGRQQEINIRMNEPLRHEGYTFFQSSFYESPPESGVFASVFAVVRNPADQWPLWGCIIITAGLLIHFGVKLGDYLRRERVRHA